MPNPDQQGKPIIEKSEQELFNQSFDKAFNVLAVEGLQYNGSALTRVPTQFLDVAFDYISRSNQDANGYYQTWTFKQGGASGTTVRTLTFTYDADGNFTSIARS